MLRLYHFLTKKTYTCANVVSKIARDKESTKVEKVISLKLLMSNIVAILANKYMRRDFYHH